MCGAHCRIGSPYSDMAGKFPMPYTARHPDAVSRSDSTSIFDRARTRPRPTWDLDQFWSNYSVRHYAFSASVGFTAPDVDEDTTIIILQVGDGEDYDEVIVTVLDSGGGTG